MPDSTNNIWIDSTFNAPTLGVNDTSVRYVVADPDNIGEYTMPVIYSPTNSVDEEIDTIVAMSVQELLPDNYINVPLSFISTSGIYDGSINLDHSIMFYPLAYSGTKNTINAYFNSSSFIDAVIENRFNYIAGNKYIGLKDISSNLWRYPELIRDVDFLSNYTNYTGSTGASGIPIGSHVGYNNVYNIYSNVFNGFIPSSLDKIVDISFAGWVNFNFSSSVYSCDEAYLIIIPTEGSFVYGNVPTIYTNTFSCDVANSSTLIDLYSADMRSINIEYEASTISGAIPKIDVDLYSSDMESDFIRFNVKLYPLKISNFSLDIGDYTTSSGVISVDVIDDENGISVVDTYFMIDGTILTTTSIPITNGYRLFYDPEDNFGSMMGPVVLTVHAQNDIGNELYEDFYVTFGYIVEYTNTHSSPSSIDYGFGNKVAVRVTVEDFASCESLSSSAWEFESRGMYNRDLTASIVGRLYGLDHSNMSSEIYPQSTAYFYGKEIRIILNAADYAGNPMEPLVLSYRIEDNI